MVIHPARLMSGILSALVLCGGTGWAGGAAEVEKCVNARVEVGELMTSYFQGWDRYGEGQRPSPERMEEMRAEIHAKLEPLLAKYDLTVESYRERLKDVLADEAAVKGYLSRHPDVKKRYDALPFDRMDRGGRSGRGD